MAPTNSGRRLKADSPNWDRQHLQFLRYSHIFSSVIREIFEVKFLEDVTPHPLTLAQFHLLKVIALSGVHQVGEVAGFLGMSPPAATKNLDKLARLGLILRNPSKGDRRATLVSPSAKGNRLVQEYENLKADRVSAVLEKFSPKEIDRLVRLLKRFSMLVIRQEDSGEGLCLWCAAYCQENCPVAHIRGGCPYEELRGAA